MELRPYTPDDEPLLDSWMDDSAHGFLQDGWLDLDSPTEHPSTYAVLGVVDDDPVGSSYSTSTRTARP